MRDQKVGTEFFKKVVADVIEVNMKCEYKILVTKEGPIHVKQMF